MYDQLGGGFHRYSVDERWLVPHFEKMLYDNALLAGTYVAGYLATGNTDYARDRPRNVRLRAARNDRSGRRLLQHAGRRQRRRRRQVFRLDARRTRRDAGRRARPERSPPFTTSPPRAISRGTTSCTWTNRSNSMRRATAARRRPNWPRELADSRQKLLAARTAAQCRRRCDDKVLVSWNGLMIEASVPRRARPWPNRAIWTAARRAADFLLSDMRRADGRLLHTWRAGPGQTGRLSGRLRRSGRRAGGALSSQFRRAVSRRGLRAGRHDARSFSRSAGGRLLSTRPTITRR